MIDQFLQVASNFDIAIKYVQDTYPVLIFIILFAFAASIGSFLGCCFYRIPRGMSLINPKRSFCPSCKTELTVIDLFPIFSYVFLRGKCRHCKSTIKPTYFIIELSVVIIILGLLYL